MWFDHHKHSSTSCKKVTTICDSTATTWFNHRPYLSNTLRRHEKTSAILRWIFACMSTSKARAWTGRPKYQEQSINLNQVRQNATRHLPEEKCSQVLGLIESTLWFSGHRLACGLIITSTQALLPKSQDHLRQQSKASFDSLFAQLSFFETPHLTRFQSSTK